MVPIRVLAALVGAVTLTGIAVAPAPASPARDRPTTYALPDGFQPEGIATDRKYAYLGSRADGSIYRIKLSNGRGARLAEGPGTPSLGVKVDRRHRLFVAGGTGGDARVVDTRTGRRLASYQLASGDSFVNDVVLTRKAVYFTDSANPVLYRLPLGRKGKLPAADKVQRIPLTGDLEYGPGNNANGIETTPDGRALLVVQTNTGDLFRVAPRTGRTTAVDLGGESLPNGDGLLREGRTLYAMQNRDNALAVLKLSRDGRAGTVERRLTDPRFDVPTTIARDGKRLLLPNPRFTTPPTPTTTYDVVALHRPRH